MYLNLRHHFGINIAKRFERWFHGEFAEYFEARFPGKSMTLVILNPDYKVDSLLHWNAPTKNAMLELFLGDEHDHSKAGGTLDNVKGKLRFVLRTHELRSTAAEYADQDDQLRPGDFPWGGAGEYNGFHGGVSGLKKEEDWELYCLCVDKLVELLTAAGRAARAKRDHQREDPSGKYLQLKISKKAFRAALEEVVQDADDKSVVHRINQYFITMAFDEGSGAEPDEHLEGEDGYSESDLD